MTDETSMIVELFGKVAALEADRDAWKRRAEAAERDLGTVLPCMSCKEYRTGENLACDTCEASDLNDWHKCSYVWRGPCEENGGVQYENTRSL